MPKVQDIKVQASEWVNQTSFNYKTLRFRQNRIKASNFQGYSDAFGKNVLKDYFKFSFKLHSDTKVGFGISDLRNSTKGFLQNDFIYYSFDGKLFADFGVEDKKLPIHSGDTVTVLGNLNKGTIEFLLNNVSIAIHFSDNLMNSSIEWVPYIYLWKNSEVEIVENFTQIPLLPTYLAESWFMWDFDALYGVNGSLCLIESEQK